MYKPLYDIYEDGELKWQSVCAKEASELIGCATCNISASVIGDYLIKHKYRVVRLSPTPKHIEKKSDIETYCEILDQYGNLAVSKNIDSITEQLKEKGYEFTYYQMSDSSIQDNEFALVNKRIKKTYIIELNRNKRKEKFWWWK